MEQPLFLKIYKDKELIQVKQFLQEQVIIGRNPDLDVILEDESVFPVHAVIEERDGGCFLCDMGSESGVKKNGERILDENIDSGDVIEIGPYRIEFHIGIPMPKKKPPRVVVHPEKSSESKKKDIHDTSASQVSNEAPPPPLEHKTEHSTKMDSISNEVSQPSGDTPDEEKTFIDEDEKNQYEDDDTETVTDFSINDANNFSLEEKSKEKNKEDFSESKGLKIKPYQHSEKRGGGASPFSSSGYARDVVLPESGATLEIVVAWEDRILSTYHINEKMTVRVGAHPKNDVVVPVFSRSGISHPLVKMDSLAEVFITSDMEGEWTSGREKYKLRDLIQNRSMRPSGGGYVITLQQGEMLRMNWDGGVSVYVRYVSTAVKPLVGPVFDFSSSELTSFVVIMIMVGLMGLYMNVYTSPVIEDKLEPEKKRVATFQYKPPQPIRPVSRPKVKPKLAVVGKVSSKNKKRVAKKVTQKKKVARKKKVPRVGKASAAASNKSKTRARKKLTTPNPGRKKGIRRGQRVGKVRGGGGAKQKDVKDTGLLSVFGTKGAQDQLQKALQGSDAVSGLSQEATGSGRTKAVGAGTDIGQGLKDLGKGGKGVSTVGISGVKTKGIGGGDSGYGLDASGSKKRSVTIEAGGEEEEFMGEIDKEAVRRVIKRGENQIKNCYERVLNTNPGLRGKVVLQWSIIERGRVRNAKVVRGDSTLKNQSVYRCIISRLKTWRFPEPPIGTYADIRYPFVFTY